MITYKFVSNTSQLFNISKQYNSVKRVAYNIMKKDNLIKLSTVESICKNLNNIDQLDASFIKLAVNEAKSLKKKNKVIFARNDFLNLKFKRNGFSKSNYLKTKNSTMLIRGSKSDPKGNRKATLDINNDQIIFKPKRGINYNLKLIGMSDKRKKILLELQSLCESNKGYFTLGISNGYVSITFDDSFIKKDNSTKRSERILSIDLNPNFIGLVVMESNKIIHKEIIDYVDLNQHSTKNNKRIYEKIESSIYITKLANHYKCEAIAIEKLNIKSSNKGKGNFFNRLCNNVWQRNIIVSSLKKHSKFYNIKLIEIHPAYSSFIGCILNEKEFDSIAAAIEINRRALELLKNGTYRVLPNNFNISNLSTRWKKMVNENNINSWLEFYEFCKKKSYNSYRNLFNRKQFSGFSFRLKSYKTKILIHLV